MSTDTAREFHALTSHAPARPAPGGPMRWEDRPLPAKFFHGVEHVDLPGEWPVEAPPTDLAGLARLLFLAAGVSRVLGRGDRKFHFRTYPSAGALYPNEVYVACRDLEGLPAGLYHYEPIGHRLDLLREGDVRGSLSAAAASEAVAAAPLSLVVTGIPWRTTWKYGPRGYRHLFWDAGTLLANATAATASAGAETGLLVGFVDAAVTRLLDLAAAPFTEFPLAILTVGAAGEAAGRGDPVPLLEHKVEPLSARVPDEPELTAVHRAGDLADPEAVADWRRRLAPEGDGGPWAPDRTEEVILARGSARRFDPRVAVPEQTLRGGLEAAVAYPSADVELGIVDAYLSVHAVEGVRPGRYRWSPAGLAPVNGGSAASADGVEELRRISRHLCLDQRLGGNSAFTAFFCADLDRLLEAGGARAYRLAQLGGGLAAGRLQLAAFASGSGGTGLTFYDREISRVFATDDAALLVSAVGQPGYEAAPGRRPADQRRAWSPEVT